MTSKNKDFISNLKKNTPEENYYLKSEPADVKRWVMESSTRSGRFSPTFDGETATFGSVVLAITAVLLIIGGLLIGLVATWWWIPMAFVCIVPILFTLAFLITLTGDFFTDLKTFKLQVEALRFFESQNAFAGRD